VTHHLFFEAATATMQASALLWTVRIGWLVLASLCLPVLVVPFLERATHHGKQLRAAGRVKGWWDALTVPKAWFTHFYVFGAVVNAVGLYLVWLKMMPVEACANAPQRLTFEVQLSAVLFELHLIRRAVECYTVHSFQGSQMHALAYVLGLVHYLLAALTFATEGCQHAVPSLQHALQLVNVRHAAGIALFVVGNLEQNRAHKHLASLRTSPAAAAGGYSLPTEGWFQQIDCPHYFWEIMIYTGLIVITAAQAPGLYFMTLWSALNLSIVASQVHTWYTGKFDSYPTDRKRIFPWVW
jgi:3-oxo-5-alpha-steroid 4-dehydrogenase 3 / polyprenol reductase